MHQLQRSWVRSRHPSAQWNLRGGRWSSVEYGTILFPLFATGVIDTSSKFAAIVVDTGGKLPLVSLTPAANLPPLSLIPVANCHWCYWRRRQICRQYRWHPWQNATNINNTSETGGKICRRCRWYRWQICHRCQRLSCFLLVGWSVQCSFPLAGQICKLYATIFYHYLSYGALG